VGTTDDGILPAANKAHSYASAELRKKINRHAFHLL
jgi:hypothetical protein